MRARCKTSASLKKLRALAEQLLATTRRDVAQVPADDVQKLVHELQVHQVELEMQNDELRRTQLELEAARDRYAALFNFAPVAYLTLNPQGEVLEANLNAAELLGLERGRLIRQKFTRFVPAEAQDTFYLFCRQVFSSDARQSAELELVNAQAKRLFVHAEAVRDPASTGKQGRFSFIDITERNRAEAGREAQAQQRQLALNAARLGWWHYDPVTKIASVDERCKEIFGISESQCQNEKILELLHPDDLSRVWTLVEAAMNPADPKPYATEYRVNRPDGSMRWVEAHGLAAFAGEGAGRHATGFAGTVADITARKRAEAALLASNERLQRVLKIETVGVMFWDAASGVLMDANDTFLKLMGYSRREVEARELTWQRLTPPEFLEASRAELRKFATTGRVGPYEKEYLRKDGSRTWFVFAGSALGDGTIVEFCVDVSTRKQAEARFQLMAATIEDVLYIVDGVTGEFQYVSPAFERLLGYTLSDVAGMGGREKFLAQVIQGGGFTAQRNAFHELQAHHSGQAPTRWEAWWRGKNGALRCFEDCWIPLYTGNTLTSTYGVLRDVTERKQVEAALRESERQYRSLFENSVDAIILAEPPSGRFTAGNPAALKMFGAGNEAEFVAHGPMDLSPERQPDGRLSAEKARNEIAAAMREGSRFFEWAHRRISGEEFFADVLLTRLERDGRPVVLATVRDITGRKRAENALRTSERSLRILTRALEQNPASVVITSTSGEIEYVNPKFTEVTGYSLAEVLGKNPRVLKSGHQSPEFYRELWTTITSGRDWRGEFCNRKKNGALYWESAVIAPIHDEHGAITHFVALKEDITERRRLEFEVLEVADHEQQRIGQDLHDGLGQRLTALEMKCFLLLEDLAADDRPARRRQLQKQAEHISQALRECVTVTRSIAHGLAPVVLKTEGLTGALAKLAHRAHVPGRIECRFVCRRPVALDDFQTAMQLYRIAQEAVNNALKHARTRRIRIHLAHNKGTLRLQIKDAGRGLPKRKKPKAGMGLEVMRHRAHAIGAILEIASKPGKGVSITCTLPIKNHEN